MTQIERSVEYCSMATSTKDPAHYAFSDLGNLVSRMTGDEKHLNIAYSILDVVWVLYDRVLRISPSQATHPDRDRFLLSKGHGPHAYFATLAAKGFFPVSWLDRFGEFDSPLGHHPDRMLVPGVEMSSGSLGHGLPIAVGSALALRAQNRNPRVFCLIGDGELDEGSNHEALIVAGRLQIGTLTLIVLDNDSSELGWPGGLVSRFELEGWSAELVNGRDHDALVRALDIVEHSLPRAVIARVSPSPDPSRR